MDLSLNGNYWNCECPEDYIHAKVVGNYCEKCNTFAEGQPDSHYKDVQSLYNPRYDNAVFKDTPEVEAIHEGRICDKGVKQDKFDRVTLAIHFCDLIESTQKDVLDFYGLESEEDGNFEISPLFILEVVDDN